MIDMEKFPALKSLNRFIITFFFVMGVTFNMVAPFSIVKAESPTYIVVRYGEPLVINENLTFEVATRDAEIRFTILGNESNYTCWGVAIGRPSYKFIYPNSESGTYFGNTYSLYDENGVRYFGEHFNSLGEYVKNQIGIVSPYNYFDTAYNYTYGSSAVDPVETNYGNIKDLSYSTNIVGSGTTTGDANIDTISWYPYWDTNSNISTTWNMEIQVVPGTWQGGTNTDIFSQTYQDFIINESGAMSIYHGTYLNGSYSISWGEVKNKLSILSWADLFQYFDGSYWNKKGWVYRARFNDPDTDYWSEWQTVYTVTSSSGEGVENFINPEDGTGLPDFYNNAVNSYNTTSVVNNNNNITYYYVNTPVDTNPSSDDSTQYLKEIRDTIIQIRKMIAIDNNSDTNINNNNNPWIGDPAAELYDFENDSINDFNDAVGDLPTSDLITGNKFLAASTWVRTQYETLVSNTPFEAVIIFSLLLGFGLLLIGKLR